MPAIPPELVLPPLDFADELRLRWSHDSLFGRASASLEALLRSAPGQPLIPPRQMPETSLRLAAPAGPGWHTLDGTVAGGAAIAHALPAPLTLVASRLEHSGGAGLLLALEPEPALGGEDATAAILLVLPIAEEAVWTSSFTVLLIGTEAPGLRLWVEFHGNGQRLPLYSGERQSLGLSGEMVGQALCCHRWCFPPPGPALVALREGGSAHLVLGLPAAKAWRFGLLDAGLLVHPALRCRGQRCQCAPHNESNAMYRRHVIGAAGLLLSARHARAQEEWPSRTVTIVVPFAPGSSSDIIGRAIAQGMQQALGKPVVAENRPCGDPGRDHRRLTDLNPGSAAGPAASGSAAARRPSSGRGISRAPAG